MMVLLKRLLLKKGAPKKDVRKRRTCRKMMLTKTMSMEVMIRKTKRLWFKGMLCKRMENYNRSNLMRAMILLNTSTLKMVTLFKMNRMTKNLVRMSKLMKTTMSLWSKNLRKMRMMMRTKRRRKTTMKNTATGMELTMTAINY